MSGLEVLCEERNLSRMECEMFTAVIKSGPQVR